MSEPITIEPKTAKLVAKIAARLMATRPGWSVPECVRAAIQIVKETDHQLGPPPSY